MVNPNYAAHRIAGEIAPKSLAPDTEKTEKYFEHALSVVRAQEAKSWELRTAMSMARLGATRASRSKRANCLLRFTGVPRKGLTHAI
jgi:hypothetical protein